MHLTSFSHLSKLLLSAALLAAPIACGDDKEGETENAGTTTGTNTTQTTPGTSTDPTSTTDPTTTDPTSTTNGTDPTGGPNLDGQFCQEECAVDADCTVNGMDLGFTCKDGRCAGEPGSGGGCATDQDCQAQFSGWVTACQSDADCPGQVCIDIGDAAAGRCATPPSDFLMCETIMQSEITAKKFMDGSDVQVCSNTDWTCGAEGICENPCESDADCAQIPGFPKCNVGTGACECGTDDDCKNAGVAGFAVCNNGVCGCGTDTDCAGATNADKCYDGFCGCSDATVCTTKSFDGTMTVCEKF